MTQCGGGGEGGGYCSFDKNRYKGKKNRLLNKGDITSDSFSDLSVHSNF